MSLYHYWAYWALLAVLGIPMPVFLAYSYIRHLLEERRK